GLRRVTQRAKELFPLDDLGVFVGALLDDVSVVGPPTAVQGFADALDKASVELNAGLEMNTDKMEIFPTSPAAQEAFADTKFAGVRHVEASEGVKLLGV